MPETYKQMTIKIPISLYEETLILASKNGIGLNDWLVSVLNSMVMLLKEKPELVSFLDGLEEGKEIECPVYKRAIALLEIIP